MHRLLGRPASESRRLRHGNAGRGRGDPRRRRSCRLSSYAEGLRFYREEKLEEAITEWKLVLNLDPQHPSARKNIEQAEAILKRLEQRRKR